MLSMGFEGQVRLLLSDRNMNTKDRQTLMYSATFPPSVEKIANKFLRKERVWICVGERGSVLDTITQEVHDVHGAREQVPAQGARVDLRGRARVRAGHDH